jgi:arsenite oxidase small subunit
LVSAAAKPGNANPERRALLRQAACVASTFAATSALPVAAWANGPKPFGRSQLVTALGDPFKASNLVVGEPWLFTYPFAATPVFLLALDRAVEPTALATSQASPYTAPAGVGPKRNIVAFSAVCTHKLVYPTQALSFIGVRKGKGGRSGEPSHVVQCCADHSVYDPTKGAAVLSGPAPQPLASVVLAWDAASDSLEAVGTQGAQLWDAFFAKYAFKLETELGPKAKALAADRCVVQPAAAFSKQWQVCGA